MRPRSIRGRRVACVGNRPRLPDACPACEITVCTGSLVLAAAGPGEYHDIGFADLVEGGVAANAEHAVICAHFAASVPDEHHVDRRNALQHLVGPDTVECGEPWEQRDGDQYYLSFPSATT
jgi:hypothetical protein